MRLIATFCLLVLCSVGVPVFAADPPAKLETYLTAKAGGPDFATQGEYVGTITGGTARLGAQVIALGQGQFKAVFFVGGLPGDGWDGKTRTEVEGRRDGDIATFKGSYNGSISFGKFAGKTDKAESFSLKRIERVSPDENEKMPKGAVVLFDGTNTDAWVNGKMDERKLLETGTKTKAKYQDFAILHVEFLLPFKPLGRDQDRGNSGIYIQDRYEVQILDTFGHAPEFNGIASTYRQKSPTINMCYPPLQWQTYDIAFTAAKFDAAGMKTKNAWVSVRHNGVVVQEHTELTDHTGAGQKEGPEAGPIQIQGHGNPVFFRNIWILEKK